MPKALRIYETMQAEIAPEYTIHTYLHYARADLLLEMNRPADALPLINAAAQATLYSKSEMDRITTLKAKIEAALKRN